MGCLSTTLPGFGKNLPCSHDQTRNELHRCTVWIGPMIKDLSPSSLGWQTHKVWWSYVSLFSHTLLRNNINYPFGQWLMALHFMQIYWYLLRDISPAGRKTNRMDQNHALLPTLLEEVKTPILCFHLYTVTKSNWIFTRSRDELVADPMASASFSKSSEDKGIKCSSFWF